MEAQCFYYPVIAHFSHCEMFCIVCLRIVLLLRFLCMCRMAEWKSLRWAWPILQPLDSVIPFYSCVDSDDFFSSHFNKTRSKLIRIENCVCVCVCCNWTSISEHGLSIIKGQISTIWLWAHTLTSLLDTLSHCILLPSNKFVHTREKKLVFVDMNPLQNAILR